MTAFAEHLKNHYVPNSVIVDSTASEVPAAHYLEWMQKGLHIITPNKKLNSGPLEQYLALRQFQRESYIHYFYEVCSAFCLRLTRSQCYQYALLNKEAGGFTARHAFKRGSSIILLR